MCKTGLTAPLLLSIFQSIIRGEINVISKGLGQYINHGLNYWIYHIFSDFLHDSRSSRRWRLKSKSSSWLWCHVVLW